MENLGNHPEQPRNFILENANQLYYYITDKYKIKLGKPEEARTDAIMYAGAQLAYHRTISYFHPEDIDPWNEEQLSLIDKALGEAILRKNWSPMKEYLQKVARTATGGAMAREGLREMFSEDNIVSGEEQEKEGEAFFNLANSLNT